MDYFLCAVHMQSVVHGFRKKDLHVGIAQCDIVCCAVDDRGCHQDTEVVEAEEDRAATQAT